MSNVPDHLMNIITRQKASTEAENSTICIPDRSKVICNDFVNTLSAKDGDLRLSVSNACLPKTEISVLVTECVFFTSTCYKLHMFTLHDVLYS